jgi:hypothetical protein
VRDPRSWYYVLKESCSISLLCDFSPGRWRKHVSPKHRHWPTHHYSAKIQKLKKKKKKNRKILLAFTHWSRTRHNFYFEFLNTKQWVSFTTLVNISTEHAHWSHNKLPEATNLLRRRGHGNIPYNFPLLTQGVEALMTLLPLPVLVLMFVAASRCCHYFRWSTRLYRRLVWWSTDAGISKQVQVAFSNCSLDCLINQPEIGGVLQRISSI